MESFPFLSCCLALPLAFAACALSGIGYFRLPGRPNWDLRSLLRFRAIVASGDRVLGQTQIGRFTPLVFDEIQFLSTRIGKPMQRHCSPLLAGPASRSDARERERVLDAHAREGFSPTKNALRTVGNTELSTAVPTELRPSRPPPFFGACHGGAHPRTGWRQAGTRRRTTRPPDRCEIEPSWGLTRREMRCTCRRQGGEHDQTASDTHTGFATSARRLAAFAIRRYALAAPPLGPSRLDSIKRDRPWPIRVYKRRPNRRLPT